MKNIYLYIEGGGDRAQQQSELRSAFKILLEKAGFKGHMPRILACGGRDQAFHQFKKSFTDRSQADIAILLVDAEDPVASNESSINAPVWKHLKERDKWERPDAAQENQVALMVTSIETWIIADHAALKAYFGPKLKEKHLLPLQNLESRKRKDVLDALEKATEDCGRDRQYRKGAKSFQVLATVNPHTLQQNLPHFKRFIDVLRHHLA